jgi:hypothetical protein
MIIDGIIILFFVIFLKKDNKLFYKIVQYNGFSENYL